MVSWTTCLALAGALAVAGAIIALPADSSSPAGPVTVSPDGSDQSCARNGSACATFNRAYQIAQPGDTVRVEPGAYAPTTPSESANKILPSPKPSSEPITFVCASEAPVTQSAPGDQFVITAQHVVIRGGCFRFNRLWLGDAPNNSLTEDVTIDGVSMQTFEISGSTGITIQNSTVGPVIACYAPGNAASCRNLEATNEAYWYAQGKGNTDYNQPKVHNVYGVNAGDVLLKNNLFTRVQTRDGSPSGLHTGCLWLGNASYDSGPITLEGNTFRECATYDIHAEGIANVVLRNNDFGAPVEPIDVGSDFSREASVSQADVQYKSGTGTPTNWLVEGNKFSHGISLNFGGSSDATVNVRFVDNDLGRQSNCAAADVLSRNTNGGTGCGGGTAAPPVPNGPPPETTPTAPPAPAAPAPGTPAPAAPAPETPVPAAPAPFVCDNDLDDDKDGRIDLADRGCASHDDMDETDPAPANSGPKPVPEAPAPTTPAEPRPEPSPPSATPGTLPTDVVLRRGSTGEVVRALQQALTELGYVPGPADGSFGPATEQAVIAFQKHEGLVADGVAGEQTLTAINTALAGR